MFYRIYKLMCSQKSTSSFLLIGNLTEPEYKGKGPGLVCTTKTYTKTITSQPFIQAFIHVDNIGTYIIFWGNFDFSSIGSEVEVGTSSPAPKKRAGES